MSSKKLHVDHNHYTQVCTYKTELPFRWVLNGISVVCYFIPIVVLLVLFTRILHFHQKKRRQIQVVNSAVATKSIYFVRYKISHTFAILFFVFVFPYAFFVLVATLRITLNKTLRWFVNMYLQQVSSVLGYTSSFISPTVMICRIPDLTSSFLRKQKTRGKIHDVHRLRVLTLDEHERRSRRENENCTESINMATSHSQEIKKS